MSASWGYFPASYPVEPLEDPASDPQVSDQYQPQIQPQFASTQTQQWQNYVPVPIYSPRSKLESPDYLYTYSDHRATFCHSSRDSLTVQPARPDSAFSTVGALNTTYPASPAGHPTEAEAQIKSENNTIYPSPPLYLQHPGFLPTANISFQPGPHHPAVSAGVVVNGNSSALNTPRQAPITTPATPVNSMPSVEATSVAPPGSLRSPPDNVYVSFDALIAAVQSTAKEQGFGIVKLRASNYRDQKPTRYDLVCDRGGVKYSSTAKKRNPSTRKVDCPWKAKAVCEVQLGNRWRFQVQCHEHNHEPRLATAAPGQENTPMAQSIRSLTNKLDRMSHDMAQGFARIEQRLEGIEKRLDTMQGQMNTVETRMSGMETRGGGMDVPMDNMGMGEPMLDGTVM
ncbi:hypothetical protein F4818DRAFT_452669 [Hypoxylon cercidicola]|nr:hypothetical protein F4818DRAFT_452669 [Hypoxylon cercidicola]